MGLGVDGFFKLDYLLRFEETRCEVVSYHPSEGKIIREGLN